MKQTQEDIVSFCTPDVGQVCGVKHFPVCFVL